jgi:hypothetical protein
MLENLGKRKIAFSILPLSLRAGIQIETEYLSATASSVTLENGLAKRNWFKQSDLKIGSFATYLLMNQDIIGIFKAIVNAYCFCKFQNQINTIN